jgi:uncharacterized protein (TIGR02118 family)
MIRVSVVYYREQGKSFDLNYYAGSHMRLVQTKLKPFGLKGVELEVGVDETTPHYVVGSLLFDTLEEYQTGFAEVGQELLDDIPNYTTVNPVVQVSEFTRLS